MNGPILQPRQIALTLALALSLAGCGGAKMLKNPEPLVLTEALAVESDQRLTVMLDWVIVREGPGTWARNADWDEYLLRLRNNSDERVRITGVTVYDSLDTRQETQAKRPDLVKASRATAKRYKGEGLKVKAGLGGTTLMAAGGAAYVAGMSVGYAALGGSTAAASAAGAAVAGIAIAPVFMIGGIVRAVNNNKVAAGIVLRQSKLPIYVDPRGEQRLDCFFPLAPSPTKLEITYEDSNGEHRVYIDTHEILSGLHLAGGIAQASNVNWELP